MGNAKGSHRDVSRAARVASSPESRLKPGNSPSDKAHSAALAKVERIHQSRLGNK